MSDNSRNDLPDGEAILAKLLLASIRDADERKHPIECWNREDFDLLQQEIRRSFHELREFIYAERLKQVAMERMGVVPEDMAAAAAHQRKFLRKTERNIVIPYFNVIRKKLENERTKEVTAAALRQWVKACNNKPDITQSEMAALLQSYVHQATIETPSDGVTRGMLEKIERGDFETEGREWPVAQGTASSRKGTEQWAYELMPPDAAAQRQNNFLPAPDLDEKVRRAMVAYAQSLGDRDSDLMILAMAKFAEQAKNPDDKVTLRIDDLMAALGYVKKAGSSGGESFGAQEKTAVRERFERLENGYLTIRAAGRQPGTNRALDIESAVLMIEDRVGQADLDGRVRDWTAVTVRFGRAWSTRLFNETGRMTALLQAKALAYDAIKERYEKRLLKRLGWYWKLNAGKTVTAPRLVQEWLRSDLGVDEETLSKYRVRDAERFEQAMDRLQQDGQISWWRYTDGQPQMTAQAGRAPRDWLAKWLEREIEVAAPQSLQALFQQRTKLALAAQNRQKELDELMARIGPKFKALRVQLGVTGLQAARDLGINNAVLSRIETGKRNPTSDQFIAMRKWMDASTLNR